jgi:raffinose/stachyose/melibiose transport system permease protein
MMDPRIDSPSRLRWTSCPASLNWLNLHGIVLSDPARRAAHRGYAVASGDLWQWWGFPAVIFFAAFQQVDTA